MRGNSIMIVVERFEVVDVDVRGKKGVETDTEISLL